MPRGSVKDVKTKCRNMRKSKLKEVCENELTEEEMEIFLMKIADKYYNPRISQEVGKCEKSVSNIFMRAVRKLREYAVKALKEKKGIQHHFDMAKMYGQKAFFGRSRHDCNRMIINAAVASYLAKICDDEI